MSDADKARDVAGTLEGLVAEIHWARLAVQQAVDKGLCDPMLFDLRSEADHCFQAVDELADDLELDNENEDEGGAT
jgi:hypothetical protein